MTEVSKLSTTKEVLTYLVEKFPNCFQLEGDAKPLKIGIFDDLAKRLEDDEKVSKTRLRMALRHYTSSWRYLRSVKAGVERVDLDGADAGAVEQEHAEHALENLRESKAKVAARKAAAAPSKAATGDTTKPAQKARAKVPNRNKAGTKPKSNTPKTKAPAKKLTAVNAEQLKVGAKVLVKAGKSPVAGEVVAVERNDVHVQLQNGLTVKVSASAVFVA